MPYTLEASLAGENPLWPLAAGLACGILIGVERGWRQREAQSGTRVAGIRTFALIGGIGALCSLIARLVSQAMGAVVLAGLVVMLVTLFLRSAREAGNRDGTTMVAALVTLSLGLLAGASYMALAIAGAAAMMLILATRRQSHGLIDRLSQDEVLAIARYAVLALAILPFLPDARYGPYDAWNPFQLWLVVLLITGFSIAGYVASRLVGQRRGTIVTALIGGAYSSTAVTASLAARLTGGAAGPFATGIALASAVMYVRVTALTAIIAPSALWDLAVLLGPAAVIAFAVTALLWRRETSSGGEGAVPSKKPFDLLPAFGFLAAVAGASLLVRWAHVEFGEAGGGLSLFIAGSFDVDAAIVAYSALPAGSVGPHIAALALAGTVAVNMAFKTAIVLANARWRRGRASALALMASTAVLCLSIGVEAARLFL